LYDPCPVGYCLPDKDFWKISQVSFRGGGETSNSIQKGVYWKLEDGSESWYPQTGYFFGNTTSSDRTYMRTKAGNALYINTYGGGDIQHTSPSYPTYCGPVRCVKE
jgi:hypothetical protein